MDIRVGQGFDVHPFVDDPDRSLVLGGVASTAPAASAGHSDADVIAHACADALLGAAGLGDIGEHFPDTDPAFAGADSIDLLGRGADLVRAAGWTPGNVDCSVVTEAPKLAPGARRDAAAAWPTRSAHPSPSRAAAPRAWAPSAGGEGMACWAVAVVTSRTPPERSRQERRRGG